MKRHFKEPMRPLLIGLAICSAASFFFACSQDPASATTGATSSASGTGGAPNCEGINFVDFDKDASHPCDICLHDNCCAESADCRDKACIECVNHLVPSCGPKPRAVDKCLYTYCQPICSRGGLPRRPAPAWAAGRLSSSGPTRSGARSNKAHSRQLTPNGPTTTTRGARRIRAPWVRNAADRRCSLAHDRYLSR